MNIFRTFPSVERSAEVSGEHQPDALPSVTGQESLISLAVQEPAKRLHHHPGRPSMRRGRLSGNIELVFVIDAVRGWRLYLAGGKASDKSSDNGTRQQPT